MAKIKTGLISVADKTGVVDFARKLAGLGIELMATGGTARLLSENGIPVENLTDYTGYPEIIGGTVRTLHPKIHAGLLASRDDNSQLRELQELGIKPIDMVVVNLYPFVHVISAPSVEPAQVIDSIDIGGPTMLRSAARNYTQVAVVTNPNSYEAVAEELIRNGGELSEETHYRLALEAFRHSAHYDTVIARGLASMGGKPGVQPERLTLEYVKRQDLRYGENPQQSAAFYVEEDIREPGVGAAEQVAGPELSFNNILDLDAGIGLAREFEEPAAVVIKHTNPCGAGIADSICAAYEKAYRGDPVSAFGCVVALNRPLDADTARAIAELRAELDGRPAPYFVECLAAPDFEDGALDLLMRSVAWAARTRVLKTGPLGPGTADAGARDLRRVSGGLLVQDRDLVGLEPDALKVVTRRAPTDEEMADLRFAWLCCKHVRSNAITLARDGMLVGVGAGQMSRVDATIIACRKAGDRADGAVMASDAFFPFPDSVERAAEAGVRAVIQPGGSKGDAAVIAAADRLGLAMVVTGTRHFRH